MAKRYFFFIYPKDPRLTKHIDMCVYLLNPLEKWPAHITVAGPFERKTESRLNIAFDTTVFAMGMSNFFNQNQTTVFINVGLKDIKRIWKKPDYLGKMIPHMSIYNGDDIDYAKAVYMRLAPMRPFFSFEIDGMYRIASEKGQGRSTLRERLDLDVLPQLSGRNIDDIKRIDPYDRLELAAECFAKAIRYNKIEDVQPMLPIFRMK